MEIESGGDAPAPEQSGAVEVQAENLTTNALTARLLAQRTGKAEPAEEEEPTAEEPAEDTNDEATPEIEPGTEEQSNGTEEKTGQIDVLSKYGINLDELPPDEAEALAKQLGSRAVKRFGRLTGQKKELQERLEALEENYQQVLDDKEGTTAPEKAKDSDSPLAAINTEKELESHAGELNELIDWVGDQMHNEIRYDEENEGEEYLAELNGRKYGRTELQSIRANARQALRKEIPKRRKWIEQRLQFDSTASESFQWLDNEEDPKTQFFHQIKNNPEYEAFVNSVTAGNFAVGLMAIGWEVFQGQAQGKGNKSKTHATKGSPPPAATPQAAPPKQVAGRKAEIQKAIQAAEQRFAQSGSQNDLIALRKLKAKALAVA